MSRKFLIIKSSARGEQSVSSRLADVLKSALNKDDRVIEHDLGALPLPVLDGELLSTFGAAMADLDAGAKARSKLVDSLINQLTEADVVVIAGGMYNFGMPATLKNWFDHVLQAGRTFQYTANGPQGLLTGKKAIVVAAAGGQYENTAYAAADHFAPHVVTLLNFIGITDVIVVRAEGQAMGAAVADPAVAQAAERLTALV